MIALVCEWGGDLSVGPTGDIGVAPVQTEVQQRIIRRLLTNAGDYIWHINFGGGLGSYIGKPYSSALIEGTVWPNSSMRFLSPQIHRPHFKSANPQRDHSPALLLLLSPGGWYVWKRLCCHGTWGIKAVDIPIRYALYGYCP